VDARTAERPILDSLIVVFTLDHRELALRGEDVVEIIRMVAITPIPEADPWLKGVINIRGRITPIIDLRTRFGLSSMEPQLETPIVVVELDERQVGLVVDTVVGIESPASNEFEAPDRLTGPVHAVSAMVHIGPRLILVLDVDRICSGIESLTLPGTDGGKSS
jgi:purine-binding chemotaxis protein CheW